jgi:hypothetical protein
MDSKEKADFINHLRYHIKNDNEGYKYFIHKWNQLDEEDINSLKQPLLVMCYQEMQKDDILKLPKNSTGALMDQLSKLVCK